MSLLEHHVPARSPRAINEIKEPRTNICNVHTHEMGRRFLVLYFMFCVCCFLYLFCFHVARFPPGINSFRSHGIFIRNQKCNYAEAMDDVVDGTRIPWTDIVLSITLRNAMNALEDYGNKTPKRILSPGAACVFVVWDGAKWSGKSSKLSNIFFLRVACQFWAHAFFFRLHADGVCSLMCYFTICERWFFFGGSLTKLYCLVMSSLR